MENRTELGLNRTGLQLSPKNAKKMMENTELTQPSSDGGEDGLDAMRKDYIQQAEPVGSMPVPATVKGAVKSGLQALTGGRAHVFIDKLGERAAFERSGTRLYEALITKCEAEGAELGPIELSKLREFHASEAQHFALVADAIRRLGGDPTVQTPSADVTGVESAGLMQVVCDPRTTVNQSLHAILVAELADNAAWEELIHLAQDLGQDDLVSSFQEALEEEQEHLATVKAWHEKATLDESMILQTPAAEGSRTRTSSAPRKSRSRGEEGGGRRMSRSKAKTRKAAPSRRGRSSGRPSKGRSSGKKR